MNALSAVIALVVAAFFIGGTYYFSAPQAPTAIFADTAMAATFEKLSVNGNSNCSDEFMRSIGDGTVAAERIQGSCCSPMDAHRYQEQIAGLKKFAGIPEIPADPYDIEAKLATELMGYYDKELSAEGQKSYDYAMANSMGKGPCCCMCWGWYVYGGLAKKLIIERGFTGEQVTDLWNLSDMCGGSGDHLGHT